jgi:hypothetical protein
VGPSTGNGRGIPVLVSGGVVMKIVRIAGLAAFAALATLAVYQAQLKAG